MIFSSHESGKIMALFLKDLLYGISSHESKKLYGIVFGRSIICSFPVMKVRKFMALFWEDP
jgi:hypothetical protein